MALHTEVVDGCCVVVANLGFLGIVTYTHTNRILTTFAPNIIRHLKPKCNMAVVMENNYWIYYTSAVYIPVVLVL